MDPQAPALAITCTREIESVEDARRVVTQCINGELHLAYRGPSDLEAAQLTVNNAVFVFAKLGEWIDPLPWHKEASEPSLNTTPIQSAGRDGLTRKSTTITMNGWKYHVVAILKDPDPQPRHNSQYGGPDSQLSWPSQLIRPAKPAPSETCPMASAERVSRDKTDKKGPTRGGRQYKHGGHGKAA